VGSELKCAMVQFSYSFTYSSVSQAMYYTLLFFSFLVSSPVAPSSKKPDTVSYHTQERRKTRGDVRCGAVRYYTTGQSPDPSPLGTDGLKLDYHGGLRALFFFFFFAIEVRIKC